MSDSSHHFETNTVYPVAPKLKDKAIINGFEQYKQQYTFSIDHPQIFWQEKAREFITWFQPFTQVQHGSMEKGDLAWFLNGRLNVCYNCVDRYLPHKANQVALIHEGDEPGNVTKVTYGELLEQVCKVANALKRNGVRKGDNVCIYMPMAVEAVYAMLACARIGAPHSVVFAGFSADALAARIQDANCKVVITTNEGKRGSRAIPLKKFTDEALLQCPYVEKVFVVKHTSAQVHMKHERDIWWHEAVEKERPYSPPEWLDSEDTLFMLYTSGSTGKPKGLLHTQAGYLLNVILTHKYIFDVQEHDIYGCMADIGWITGHSYIVYGPLANGSTTFLFESLPTYPDAGRYWDCVQRHKINILYTAPTALRALMKFGNEYVEKYDLSSLKVLGTVGEPINPTTWEWYYRVIGKEQCAIVDTYWQTETGGIVMTPLPGATPMKPGSCTLPFFGIKPVLLDQHTGEVKTENGVKGVLVFEKPWPSIARTIYGDHERYLETYMKPYPKYYFTGDGALRDQDGYYHIWGRVDDVLNVSGHRLGTAEIESALVSHVACAEAAVVGIPHEIKGQAIFAYCLLKEGYKDSEVIRDELRFTIREKIGPIATPERIVVVPGLPKTRSGKIMRRLLRKIASKEKDFGDISTLADPTVVEQIIEIVNR